VWCGDWLTSQTWKKSIRRPRDGDAGPVDTSRSTESLGAPRLFDERCLCLSRSRLLSRTMIQWASCSSLSGVAAYLSDFSSWAGGRDPAGITDMYIVFDFITVRMSTCPSPITVHHSRTAGYLNPLTGTAIKHPLPDRVKPSFIIFDIRALWRSVLSVRVSGCQKLQMTA